MSRSVSLSLSFSPSLSLSLAHLTHINTYNTHNLQKMEKRLLHLVKSMCSISLSLWLYGVPSVYLSVPLSPSVYLKGLEVCLYSSDL